MGYSGSIHQLDLTKNTKYDHHCPEMLHIKFGLNPFSSSGVEDFFEEVSLYVGMAAILIM